MLKLIFVTGGVMSGLGKGITTASLGRLLFSKGYSVSIAKIDPYLNVDAGTMRPTEHGEVFVTQDGGETDQDLGNYERFLHKNFTKKHNITTGQIYKTVIEKERKGDFLGKTVQPIPHITDEIKERILDLAEKEDMLLIEVGGTVGDYENIPFLEAARQLRLELGKENVLFIHVTYVPVLENVGEQKSKPTQHSVKTLMGFGITPDILICRSKKEIDEVRKEKIALFCNMHKQEIISDPDTEIVYEMPLIFESQNLSNLLFEKMNLKEKENKLNEWIEIVNRFKNAEKEVSIGMVGKYVNIGNFQLADSYISINEALKHAGAELGFKIRIEWIDSSLFEKNSENLSVLKNLNGVIIPGGFGISGTEGKIKAINYCREKNIPFLGLCFGLQLAVVEYARNACRLDADSTEINPKTKSPVIDLLPEQKSVQNKGATMRLGAHVVEIKKGTKAHALYKKDFVTERFRHRYEINSDYVNMLEKNKLVFSGKAKDREIMQIMELSNHPFFMATQFHPEFTSWPGKPNPLFLGFVNAASQRKPEE